MTLTCIELTLTCIETTLNRIETTLTCIETKLYRNNTSSFGPPFTEATALVLSTSRTDIFYCPHSWTAPIFTPPYRTHIYSLQVNALGE